MAARSKALPGAPLAAASGYNVAQLWERQAPLTAEQQGVVDLMAQPCNRWPFGEVEDIAPESASGQSEQAKSERQLSLEATFSSSEAFYKWFSEVEAMYLSETEKKFKDHAGTLGRQSDSLGSVIELVEDTLKQFDHLKLQQLKVRSKTQSIQSTCERLSKEREQLEEFAASVESKLAYFDDLHGLGRKVDTAMQQDGTAFVQHLARIDECVAYMSSNTQYADSAAYLSKFRSLQHKALSAIKQYVCGAFKRAAQQALTSQAAARSRPSGEGTPAQDSGADAALMYVQFKASVPDLKALLETVQSRMNRAEYARLFGDIQAFYCEQRLEVLNDVVEDRLMHYQGTNQLPMLTRLGCAYLIQVTQMEHQLFSHFFTNTEADALAQVVTPLCTVLYDILRPYFIATSEISDLCALVKILKHEVLEDQFSGKEESLHAMRPTVVGIMNDVQQRLAYATQGFIRDEVALYSPSGDDLDYPARLARGGGIMEEGGAEGEKKAKEEGEEEGEGVELSEGMSLLYPPVQNTLMCLSATYSCLEQKTFGGLAQEAIQSCTDACIQASSSIAGTSGLLDSHLFLIKNLLALREQLAMFDTELSSDETSLDFSHMRDHLRRILRGESSLFAVGASNAVFQLMYSAGPRVHKLHVDTKKELEKRLKVACESFIMGVTKTTVEPLLSFITKVTATRVSAASKPLREHAFAQPSKLVGIVSDVNAALRDQLPTAIAKMKLYLASPATHAVLFKPIKSNVAEAHGQIAHLLETEYDGGAVAEVPLTPPAQLMAILDALS